MQPTSNLNILATESIVTPADLLAQVPISDTAAEVVVKTRVAIQDILRKKDKRLLAVVGPCSIHDEKAALEYAAKLAELSKQLADKIVIVMRVYFEKPRTTVGWKGLINDPDLNGTYNIGKGLNVARNLLLKINEMGLPAGTEMLDPIAPQYIADLISWTAIGARTTESQTHREMASGLSMPVGLKNGTDGNLEVALNGIKSSSQPHSFLGIDQNSKVCVVKTAGNNYGHIVLRGGGDKTNFDALSVFKAEEELKKAGLDSTIMIDCSHANSYKDHTKQEIVLQDLAQQIINGNTSIIGFMMESFLSGGNQKMNSKEQLQYGVSITDKCVSWDDTERLLLELHSKI